MTRKCLQNRNRLPVQFSRSVVSNSLRPHGWQHSRPPCPSPTPRVSSNSCPLSRWCHPTISSSVVPFSSHLQSFQASGSFQMSQLFASGGQNIGVSASPSVLSKNILDLFLLGWTGWISLQSKGLSRATASVCSWSTLCSCTDVWNSLAAMSVAEKQLCWVMDILLVVDWRRKTKQRRLLWCWHHPIISHLFLIVTCVPY